MPTFASYDDTVLSYRTLGDGTPLVCLPGGPMQDATYLGDLGGLDRRLRLVLLDHRGTGESATPQDPATYRCDRLVDDVEALRRHLGVARMDLLGHSAGANLAVLYAARHPEHVERLVLVTPSSVAVGLAATADERRAVVALRRDEPWFEPARAAFERAATGTATEDDWKAVAPLTYGHWDDVARAHLALADEHRNDEAAEAYGSEGAFDPEATRAAVGRLETPVLVLAGEVDANSPPTVVSRVAALFPHATTHLLAGGGHYPWLDDPEWFGDVVGSFLT